LPVTFAAPHPGDRFIVEGLDRNGSRVARTLQVRMVSTRLAVSDQDLSGWSGCLGAPAFRGTAVFGVVAECEPGKVALIALLGAAHSFLENHVPGLMTVSGSIR
jgi:hypothetical protein